MWCSLKAAFAKVRNSEFEVAGLLSAEEVQAACDWAGYQDRSWLYTAVTTMQAFLAQILQADRSCQRAVCGLIAHRAVQRKPTCSADTGAYCKARQRIPEGAYQRLMQQSGQALEEQAQADDRWCGRRVRVVDGSTLLIADTAANRREYPLQQGLQPGCHFPVVRVLVIFSLAVGSVLDAAIRPYQGKGTGETGMLRDLVDLFQPGDLLLGDRYFSGFWDLAWWLKRGVDVVTRMNASRPSDFRRGRRLGKNDHLVTWRRTPRPEWLTQGQAAELPRQLLLREVRVEVKIVGFRTKRVLVLTTVLDPERYPAAKLAELYRRRWQAELNLRSLKTDMGMEQLRTKHPETVRKEFAMYLLAYNCVRRVALEAARDSGRPPWRISFKGTLQSLLEFLARFHRTPSFISWVEGLVGTVGQLQVGHRPNRIEPYALKRRPKDYPPLTHPRRLYRQRFRPRS